MVIDLRDKRTIIFGTVFILILIGLLIKPLIFKQDSSNGKEAQTSINMPTSRTSNESREYFIPDGTYLLSKPVEFGIYQLDSFSLKTIKNNQENTEVEFVKPKATISLVVNSQKKCLYFECSDPILKKEKLSLKSGMTPIGIITFEGAFYNLEGKPWTEPVAEYKETIVRGLLTVKNNSTIVYSETKDFTYWDGAGE